MEKRTTDQWIELTSKVVANTYARYPVVFERGKGVKLYDVEGKEYLDFLAGISTVSLGHCHPAVTAAMKKQLGTLVHTSNLYHIPGQTELSRRLVELSFADRAFYCNSGGEANEAAIKLVRKWAKSNGRGHEIITADGSFHGRTLATVAATGQEKYQKGFEPMPEGFPKIPYGDLDAARSAVTDRTAAIMVEPIQAEGGVRVPPEGYLKGLRKLSDEKGCLLIYDEVQTGMGRTGKLFAYEHEDAPPDVMTLAKALGNGMPIGCMLAIEKVMAVFEPGNHASTFGGNPLACAAANAVLDVMTRDGFLDGVEQRGAYLGKQLKKLSKKIPGRKEVRGRGMLWGIEIEGEAGPIVKKALQNGLLIGVAGPNVLRFAPPIIVTKSDIRKMIGMMERYVLE
jgi:acetylornithine/N-succinyldiaminopimelate aminotransferase